jgi:hypothetical protein
VGAEAEKTDSTGGFLFVRPLFDSIIQFVYAPDSMYEIQVHVIGPHPFQGSVQVLCHTVNCPSFGFGD